MFRLARRARRAGFCTEAVRLARLLAVLMPDEPEVLGLLALLLLTAARRAARTGPDRSLVVLGDQDRSLWDRELIAVAPTTVVALNRAITLAEIHGPKAALTAIDTLDLDHYHLFHATRADLLRRLGRVDDAATAYDTALTLTTNTSERRFLEQQRRSLHPPR